MKSKLRQLLCAAEFQAVSLIAMGRTREDAARALLVSSEKFDELLQHADDVLGDKERPLALRFVDMLPLSERNAWIANAKERRLELRRMFGLRQQVVEWLAEPGSAAHGAPELYKELGGYSAETEQAMLWVLNALGVDTLLGGSVVFYLASLSAKHPVPARRNHALFSWQDLQVMELVARGLTNDQIAEVLPINKTTVMNRLRAILTTLGVSTRVAIAVYFVREVLTPKECSRWCKELRFTRQPPARIRVIEALCADPEATASRLAGSLGISVATLNVHLKDFWNSTPKMPRNRQSAVVMFELRRKLR